MPDNNDHEDVPEEVEAPDLVVGLESYTSNSDGTQDDED